MAVVDGGGSNALAFSTGEGFVLVDGGAPKSFDTIMASLGANAKVHTLFNTHHHIDQTGNNELFSKGATIVAHKRTLEWMSADHWVHAEERYEKARPKAARPTETFLTTGSLTAAGEQIDYGHLTLAHTNGDIYVHFRKANVLAVGDVASPLRDPALDYLTEDSSVRSRIDSSRVAVSGHSMGGGGTLAAADERSSLQAAVPLQPWHSDKTWQGIDVPTMIIGAESDSVASVGSHAEPFYDSIPSSTEKAYVELNNESHFAAGSNPDDQGAAMVSWLKKYVDDDTRYDQFLCPPPSSSDYSEWEDSYSCGGTTPPTTPPDDDCAWWEWWC